MFITSYFTINSYSMCIHTLVFESHSVHSPPSADFEEIQQSAMATAMATTTTAIHASHPCPCLCLSLSLSPSPFLSVNPSAFPRDARLIPGPAAADGPQHVHPPSLVLAEPLWANRYGVLHKPCSVSGDFDLLGWPIRTGASHHPPPPKHSSRSSSVKCERTHPIHPILSHLGLSNLPTYIDTYSPLHPPTETVPFLLPWLGTDIVVPFYFAGFSPSPRLLCSLLFTCSPPFFHSSRVLEGILTPQAPSALPRPRNATAAAHQTTYSK